MHPPIQGSPSIVMGLVASGVAHVFTPVHGQHRRDQRFDADRAALAGSLVRDAVTFHGNGPRSATVGVPSQLAGGPERHLGRAFIRIATSSRLRATSQGAPTPGFHARGRVDRIMIG